MWNRTIFALRLLLATALLFLSASVAWADRGDVDAASAEADTLLEGLRAAINADEFDNLTTSLASLRALHSKHDAPALRWRLARGIRWVRDALRASAPDTADKLLDEVRALGGPGTHIASRAELLGTLGEDFHAAHKDTLDLGVAIAREREMQQIIESIGEVEDEDYDPVYYLMFAYARAHYLRSIQNDFERCAHLTTQARALLAEKGKNEGRVDQWAQLLMNEDINFVKQHLFEQAAPYQAELNQLATRADASHVQRASLGRAWMVRARHLWRREKIADGDQWADKLWSLSASHEAAWALMCNCAEVLDDQHKFAVDRRDSDARRAALGRLRELMTREQPDSESRAGYVAPADRLLRALAREHTARLAERRTPNPPDAAEILKEIETRTGSPSDICVVRARSKLHETLGDDKRFEAADKQLALLQEHAAGGSSAHLDALARVLQHAIWDIARSSRPGSTSLHFDALRAIVRAPEASDYQRSRLVLACLAVLSNKQPADERRRIREEAASYAEVAGSLSRSKYAYLLESRIKELLEDRKIADTAPLVEELIQRGELDTATSRERESMFDGLIAQYRALERRDQAQATIAFLRIRSLVRSDLSDREAWTAALGTRLWHTVDRRESAKALLAEIRTLATADDASDDMRRVLRQSLRSCHYALRKRDGTSREADVILQELRTRSRATKRFEQLSEALRIAHDSLGRARRSVRAEVLLDELRTLADRPETGVSSKGRLLAALADGIFWGYKQGRTGAGDKYLTELRQRALSSDAPADWRKHLGRGLVYLFDEEIKDGVAPAQRTLDEIRAVCARDGSTPDTYNWLAYALTEAHRFTRTSSRQALLEELTKVAERPHATAYTKEELTRGIANEIWNLGNASKHDEAAALDKTLRKVTFRGSATSEMRDDWARSARIRHYHLGWDDKLDRAKQAFDELREICDAPSANPFRKTELCEALSDAAALAMHNDLKTEVIEGFLRELWQMATATEGNEKRRNHLAYALLRSHGYANEKEQLDRAEVAYRELRAIALRKESTSDQRDYFAELMMDHYRARKRMADKSDLEADLRALAGDETRATTKQFRLFTKMIIQSAGIFTSEKHLKTLEADLALALSHKHLTKKEREQAIGAVVLLAARLDSERFPDLLAQARSASKSEGRQYMLLVSGLLLSMKQDSRHTDLKPQLRIELEAMMKTEKNPLFRSMMKNALKAK